MSEEVELYFWEPSRALALLKAYSTAACASRVYNFFNKSELLKVFGVCCINAGNSVFHHGGGYHAVWVFNVRIF